MKGYKHILVGLDLSPESKDVSAKALEVKEALGAKLSCVHVIEPLSLAYGGDIPMDVSTIQEQIQETAAKHMSEFSNSLEIAEEDQHLIFGRPESEIHSLAKELKVDLIVVGSHGKHGLSLLLGSTANGVLQGSPCDVLAVRVGFNK
ncbi:MAG: universal stress protein UspA [Gammaproteobacteria bacterium]|nr:universal stress protein UspA [Gammaproteobacteria bacterium]|tara:strand:+ start:10 stop:450 length:441 start_codon:yes stop_codon:yes gene_type:complete